MCYFTVNLSRIGLKQKNSSKGTAAIKLMQFFFFACQPYPSNTKQVAFLFQFPESSEGSVGCTSDIHDKWLRSFVLCDTLRQVVARPLYGQHLSASSALSDDLQIEEP